MTRDDTTTDQLHWWTPARWISRKNPADQDSGGVSRAPWRFHMGRSELEMEMECADREIEAGGDVTWWD